MKLLTCIFLFISLPMLSQEIETLSWDEARINDKIALTISQAEFEKRHRPDSITAPNMGEICGDETNTTAKMLHYKGLKFELNDGMLSFRRIDFTKRKGLYFSIKDDWFDHTTTLKSFSKTYPEASHYIVDVGTDDDDVILEMISLLPAKADDRYEWQFFFKDERLQAIECFLACD